MKIQTPDHLTFYNKLHLKIRYYDNIAFPFLRDIRTLLNQYENTPEIHEASSSHPQITDRESKDSHGNF